MKVNKELAKDKKTNICLAHACLKTNVKPNMILMESISFIILAEVQQNYKSYADHQGLLFWVLCLKGLWVMPGLCYWQSLESGIFIWSLKPTFIFRKKKSSLETICQERINLYLIVLHVFTAENLVLKLNFHFFSDWSKLNLDILKALVFKLS